MLKKMNGKFVVMCLIILYLCFYLRMMDLLGDIMVKIKEFEVNVFKNFEVVDFGDDFLRREIVVILLEEVTSIFIFIILNLVFVVMYLGSVILDRRYFL